MACARGSCGCGGPAFRIHGLDGAKKGPVCPANLVCASGSSWDFPALAFALPGSGLGSALLWARSRRGPGWLGVCRWRWLHEAGHDVEFRIQGPSPVGEGFEVLIRVLCGFSSCRRFGFWPPTLIGTPLPNSRPSFVFANGTLVSLKYWSVSSTSGGLELFSVPQRENPE